MRGHVSRDTSAAERCRSSTDDGDSDLHRREEPLRSIAKRHDGESALVIHRCLLLHLRLRGRQNGDFSAREQPVHEYEREQDQKLHGREFTTSIAISQLRVIVRAPSPGETA